MTFGNWKQFSAAAGLIGVFGAPAMADVTAMDVWESWKANAEAIGQSVSVRGQSMQGDTLILQDVAMSMEMPEVTASGTISQLKLVERRDGTVAITMSSDIPYSMSVDPAQGESVDMAMIISQRGTTIIASGDPDAISYEYRADEIAMIFDKFIVNGEDIPADLTFQMTDVEGTNVSRIGDGYSADGTFSAARLEMGFEIEDPNEAFSVSMSGIIENLSGDSHAQYPADADFGNPQMLFSDGFESSGNFSVGRSSYSVTASHEYSASAMSGTSESGELSFKLGGGVIDYSGSSTGDEFQIQTSDLPIGPLSFGIAKTAFRFAMPMAETEQAAEFASMMRIEGLEIDQMIWGMFDPGAVLPRDAADIVFDVTGKLRWLFDLTDPEQAARIEASGDMPVEIYEMNLNELRIAVLGAEVNGTGALTFDNEDLYTFDGIPAPSGGIFLNIIGVNTLLDRLTDLGYMTPDVVMGARMMLGILARPGDGEDRLISEIQVFPDGRVLANGQPLP